MCSGSALRVLAARKRWAERRCLRRRSLRDCSAVLAPAAGLQTRLRSDRQALKCPADAPLLDDAKGRTLRPTLARGRPLGWGEGKNHLVRGNVSTAAADADAPPLSRRLRNGAPAGSLRACLSERSEFAGPPLA